ncbi:uncharacterized protein (TIGR02246 family) [Comamonas odontotermitis]|uniref:Uncharacterized protein (TIGR02246 family) n=1 Tax=Comamonas odontotermitis TaxID=379895 RepID=A0ABR6RKA5_9BURK|nr:uncharacterized protein (TIGR02246 family) [Comamonas odontotermitis]
MRQVRICKSERVRESLGEASGQGAWELISTKGVDELHLIVQAGNEKFGAGSHWIETREVADFREEPDNDIWDLIRLSMQAWLDGAIDRHTTYFTPEAVFISPDGTCFRGSHDIAFAFSKEAERLPSRSMEIQAFQISYLSSAAAVVMMQGQISHGNSFGPQRWVSTQTVKNTDRGWLIASHQVFHRD